MRFTCLENIHAGVFLRNKNVHMRVNLRSYKIWKISSFVDFQSLYQLLHSQVCRNGLKP